MTPLGGNLTPPLGVLSFTKFRVFEALTCVIWDDIKKIVIRPKSYRKFPYKNGFFALSNPLFSTFIFHFLAGAFFDLRGPIFHLHFSFHFFFLHLLFLDLIFDVEAVFELHLKFGPHFMA